MDEDAVLVFYTYLLYIKDLVSVSSYSAYLRRYGRYAAKRVIRKMPILALTGGPKSYRLCVRAESLKKRRLASD